MQEHNQSATHQLLLTAARQAILQDNTDFLACLLQLPCEDVRQNYQQDMIHEQSQLLFLLINAVKNFCRTHPEPISAEEWKNFVSSSLTRELQQNPYYQYFCEDNTALPLDQCLKTLSGLDTEDQRKNYVEKLQCKLSNLEKLVLRMPAEKIVISGRKDSVSDQYQSYQEDSHSSDEKKQSEEKEKCIDLLLASDQSAHVLAALKCQTKAQAKTVLMASTIPPFIPCFDEETDRPKSLFEYAEVIPAHSALSYLFSRYAALNKQYPTIVHDLEHTDFLHRFSLHTTASHAPIYRRLAVFYSTREFPGIAQSLFYSAQAYIASGKKSDKTEHDRLYAHSTDEMKKKFFAQLLRANLKSDRLLTLLAAKKENILEKVDDTDKPLLAYLLGRGLRRLFKRNAEFDQQMLFYLLETQKIPTDFKIKSINFYLYLHNIDELKLAPLVADELCFFLRRALCDSLSKAEISDLQNDTQRLQLQALAVLQNCRQEAAMQQIGEYKMLLQALKAHTNLLSQDIYNALEIALMRQDGMRSFKAIEVLLDQQLENFLLQNSEEEQEEKEAAVDPNLYNAEGKKQLRILAFYLACLRCLYANVSQQPLSEKILAEQQVRYFLKQTQENPDADVERGAVLALLTHTHFFERYAPGVNGWEHTKIAKIFQLDSPDTETPYKARAIQAAHLHQQISRDIDILCAGKKLLKAYVQAYSELQQYESEYQSLDSESCWTPKDTKMFLKKRQIDQTKLAIAQLKADGLEHMLPKDAAGLEQFNSLLDINHRLRQLMLHTPEASIYDEHIQRESMQSDVNAVKDATWLPENTRAALYMLHLDDNALMFFALPSKLSTSMLRNFRRKFYANIEKIITNAGVIDDTKGRLISLLHSSSKQVDSRYLDMQTGAIALHKTQDQPVQAEDKKAEPDQQAAHEMSTLLAPTAAARRAATENLVNFLIHHYAEQIALLDEDSQEKFAVFLTEMAILYVCEYRRDEAEKETHKTIESFLHWLDIGPELNIQKDDLVQPYEGEAIYLRATGKTTCLDLIRRSGYRCTTEDEQVAREEIRYAIWQKDRSAPLPEIYGCKSATPTQVAAFEAELQKARDSYPWYPEDHLPAWYVEQAKAWWLTQETVAAYKNRQRHYRAIGYAVMPEEDAPAAVLQGEVAAVLIQIRAEREDEKQTHQAEIEMQNQTITALTNKFSAMMEAQEHLQNMFMQLMQKNEQMEKAQVLPTLEPGARRPTMASSPQFFLVQRKASGAPATAAVPANTISSGARAARPLAGEPPALPETRT